MFLSKKILNLFLFSLLILPNFSFSQDVDISQYLKEIEQGNKESVLIKLSVLKKKNPNNPSVKYLEGLVTDNGDAALKIFTNIYSKSPKSKYADASLYRVYSYYYALGLYSKSQQYLDKLKKEYPNSTYIKIAARDIPEENQFAESNNAAEEEIENTNQTDENENRFGKQIFTIQAGAFSNFDNAKKLKKEFEESGYFSEIREKNVGGTNFHVVYVGKFSDDDQARGFLQVINSNFKLNGIVVDRNW